MSGLRVVVLGYVIRGPMGGMAWHHLQYVLGLARLGHDAYFVEDSDDYPSCYDPDCGFVDTDPTYGLRFATAAFERLGLADRWAYHDAHTGHWLGPNAAHVRQALAGTDLLLNVSGVNPLRPWLADIAVRVLIDTDPVFTQIRHLTKPADRSLAEQHTAFFSFGENIGAKKVSGTFSAAEKVPDTFLAPDDGLPWQPTRQPIVLDEWPITPGPAAGKFTTVMQWDSYPPLEFAGRRYGMKSESFGPFLDLPAMAGPVFELALGSASAPREMLGERGWTVRDPLEVTRDPWVYQDYIRSSKAEFGVAKHGYVASRCGWFSERSACYLASGRPVLVQDTGFTNWLPSGLGVLAFRDPAEARAGVAEINGRYRRHCRAARDIAVEFFEARKVLGQLIERAMNCSGAAPKIIAVDPGDA